MEYDSSKAALLTPEAQPALPFDPDWQPEALCAELSRLAYKRVESSDAHKEETNAALQAAGYGPATPFVGRSIVHGRDFWAYAFGTVKADGTAVVAFRGTQPQNISNVLDDIQFWPRRWTGTGRVHRGFLRAYEGLREQIDAWLAEQPPARLVITGHSLGAAMATLMAARYPEAELVTFGSPRVGGRGFAAQFSGRTVRRYVDCYDFVTNLPPPIWFRHVAGMHYVDRHGVVHSPPLGLMARVIDRVRADLSYAWKCTFKRGSVWFRTGADHAPINYVAAVLGKRVGP
jgi:pimeloyl-ACP methyl ester carboxylesterase